MENVFSSEDSQQINEVNSWISRNLPLGTFESILCTCSLLIWSKILVFAPAGVTAFTFTIDQQYYANPGDSSETDVTSSDELALKVICTQWSKVHNYGDYWSLTASFQRIGK